TCRGDSPRDAPAHVAQPDDPDPCAARAGPDWHRTSLLELVSSHKARRGRPCRLLATEASRVGSVRTAERRVGGFDANTLGGEARMKWERRGLKAVVAALAALGALIGLVLFVVLPASATTAGAPIPP